jgi:hypothetical protein
MTDLSKLLSLTLEANNENRALGQKSIEDWAGRNFGEFIYYCSLELSDDTKIIHNRKLAATLIKNMLTTMPNYVGQWEKLALDVKTDIKNRVLGTLASADSEARKAAALAVAGIYKLEQPRNEWNQLIDVLVEISNNNNKNFKSAAIMTLGYISQEIPVSEFQISDVDKILTALILNLSKIDGDQDITKYCIIAFVNFISFAKKNFERAVIFIF